MLFNSYAFVFLFLPLCLFGLHIIGSVLGKRSALGFLVLSSLFFYAWWNPPYVFLISTSICMNFCFGTQQMRSRERSGKGDSLMLAVGVSLNLCVLAYFKYTNLFLGIIGHLTGEPVAQYSIILPLAISFFTFTQISFIVDAYRGITKKCEFLEYCFFVVYFPHLIAGPIVRQNEILPQLSNWTGRLFAFNVISGLSLFVLGLAKKTLLADGLAEYSDATFSKVDHGLSPDLLLSWQMVVSYAFQIYFDFSAYSDMAVGLACAIGIKLPLNFSSPYKALSISDFWTRWHMSLSRFLRDYLYIPLGGNRKGLLRRYGNLMITMIIGGLWHGANWTFAMWGALHGIYLVIHHTWRYLTAHYSWAQSRRLNPLKWMLTFLAVLVGWVFFRSRTFDEAIFVLRGMAGLNGVLLPDNIKPLFAKALHPLGVVFGNTSVSPMCYVWILALIPIVFFSPNSQEIFQLAEPGQGQITISRALWKPTVFWGCLCGALFALACMRMRTVHEFIYFQF